MKSKKHFLAAIVIMTVCLQVSNAQNVFQGTTYQPVSTDYSTLRRSFERQENRSTQAYQKYSELAQLIGEKRQKISNDRETLIWFEENINSMLKNVKSSLDVGDYSTAYNRATEYMGEIYSNTELSCRIRTYEEYVSVVESIRNRTDLTYQQKQEWYAKYSYRFVPMRNQEGKVIGAKRWVEIGGPNNTPVIIP